MALNKNTKTATDKKEFEKAKAFVNISLPTRDGKKIRLQAIPLNESNDTHKQLLDYLNGADVKGEYTAEMRAEREASVAARIQIDIGYPRSAEDSALAL